MELLYRCSLMRGSNYFLSNFRSLRVNRVFSCRGPNGNGHINSTRLFVTEKTFTAVENEDPLMSSVRPYSTMSFFDKIKYCALFFKRERERSALALHLYKSMDNINFKEFYEFFDMPDTFNSWFILMELHLWMMLSQLMDKEEGIELRTNMVEIFWCDVETRIDALKLNTPKIVKKQLKELSGGLPITFLVYDEGLLSNDSVLAGAIWYKFFDKKSVDPRKIEVLVRYIRYQVQHLSLLDLRNSGESVGAADIWKPVTTHMNAVMSEN